MSSGICFSISILFIDLLNLSNLLTSCWNRDDLALLYFPTIIVRSLMCIFACFLEICWFYMHTFSGLWNYCYIFNCTFFPPTTVGLEFTHVALYLHMDEKAYSLQRCNRKRQRFLKDMGVEAFSLMSHGALHKGNNIKRMGKRYS